MLMGYSFEITETGRTFDLADQRPDIHRINAYGTWVRAFNEGGDEVEVTIRGLTPDKILDHLKPVMPVSPSDYRPSGQVQLLITMINDGRRYPMSSQFIPETEIRFNDGYRHGLNVTFRALVELETGITEPELLDELCADMIQDDLADGRAG